MQKENIQEILRNRNSGHANKKFVFNLLPFEFDFDNPILQLALHPQLLAAANAYLGMYAHLQGIELWLNFPTEGEATETQLWHRDGDDRSQLKTFIYLNDVGEKTGPFCYIPESNPTGKLKIKPTVTKGGRVVDESMAAAVSPELVGRTESHGCFRLANWNAEYLLRLVAIGTPVFVQP